jgi:hypothetical protein
MTKISWLLLKEIIAVNIQNHTKPVIQNAALLIVSGWQVELAQDRVQ